MKLETRLLLLVGGVLLAVFAGDATFAYRAARERAITEMELQAEKVRSIVMATRRVYQRELLDSGLAFDERTLPLLPAHALSRISDDFANWDTSGLSFNNVSDQPRNPRNRADAIEQQAIARFRAEPELQRTVLPFRTDANQPFYLFAWPIRIEPYCLKCHGDRADAPSVIRARYDTGYGYKLGDLRGVMSVKVPAANLESAALATLPGRLGAHLAGLLVVFFAVGGLIRRFVRRPLDRLARGMGAVAAGNYGARVAGVNGEFARLADSFNRMAAQIPLHHSEIRRLSQAVEQSPVMVVITELDATITYVNRKFSEVSGYAAEEAVGRNISLLKSGLTPPEAYGELWQALLSGKEWRGELLNRRKDGSLYWELASISPLRDGEGAIRQYLAVKEDVTERKLAQQAAKESEERLRQVLDHTGEGIFGMDRGGSCTFINPAAVRMLGYDGAEQLLDRNIHGLIHHTTEEGSPNPQSECRAFRAMLAGEPAHSDNEVFWRRDGTRFPVEYRSQPIVHEGKVAGAVVSFTDISERRVSELVRRQMVDQLVRSNTELERFAYVASHDLQEPLRSVASYAQLLQRRYHGKLDADADTFIAYMVGGVERMHALINDLLAYAQLQHREASTEPVDAGEALGAARRNLADAVERSHATFTIGELPTVMADRVQLVGLFQNLVGNAIKFTRPNVAPEVAIAASRVGGQWEFAVADNGIGIPPAQQARVFDIFHRLHTQSEYPGTGVGLALCKRIVERHGGRIWVDSTPGAGASFHFTLPAVDEEMAPT